MSSPLISPGSSVYIHIPFCQSKCPYCDFYSLPLGVTPVPDAYVAALCLDIQHHLHSDAPLNSVFVGGGTPSLLSVAQVERIVDALNAAAEFAVGMEFSIEVNPGSTDETWLAELNHLGVNRLSIGVQSFQDEALILLGRTHTGAEAQVCVNAARRGGFDNINVDMMFALPRTLSSEHCRNLLYADQACIADIAPEHVSVYGLTAESGTPFATRVECGDLDECEEEEFAEQFMLWHHALLKLGYTHYEISNYARPGRECRHNMAYWQRQPNYAFGAGAHGFTAADFGMRFACAADVSTYIDAVTKGKNPRTEVERFCAEQAMAEWVYLRLRTADGVDGMEFQRRFGLEFEQVYAEAIRSCGSALCTVAGRWFFPPETWLLYNHHVKNFLCLPPVFKTSPLS